MCGVKVGQGRHGHALIEVEVSLTQVEVEVGVEIGCGGGCIEARQSETIASAGVREVAAEKEAPNLIGKRCKAPESGEDGAGEAGSPVEERQQGADERFVDGAVDGPERTLKALKLAQTVLIKRSDPALDEGRVWRPDVKRHIESREW